MSEMPELTPDTEILLSAGDLRARVSPYGASLRGVWRELPEGTQQEIVTAYSGATHKVGGQGDVLIPFPGRVAGGRYTFEGTAHQMKIGDKDGPNTIHGFLRTLIWETLEVTENSAAFVISLGKDDNPGYPFALRTGIRYTLTEDGLTCGFQITNTGTDNAPVAVGFHPYFTVGSEFIDGDTLTVPMASTLEFVNLIPTGKVLPVEGTSFDFRQAKTIGGVKFNTCYLDPVRDPDGKIRIILSAAEAGRSLTVWMDESFGYAVLYSIDPIATHARRSLAIEPMTCGSDAFNHPQWGLKALAPGETFAGEWGVAV